MLVKGGFEATGGSWNIFDKDIVDFLDTISASDVREVLSQECGGRVHSQLDNVGQAESTNNSLDILKGLRDAVGRSTNKERRCQGKTSGVMCRVQRTLSSRRPS